MTKTLTAVEETVAVLGSDIDKRHLRQIKKPTKNGDITLDFYPWAVLCRCLHHRVPGWSFELLEVKQMADWVVVSGRLKIPMGEGEVSYDAVSSEPLETKGAPPIETAASSCLRRACALAGLGLELWLD
ncbi:hypothetical protein OAL13_00075 [bacterium]|nr:hypothetical protein [bacterium]